MRGRGQVEVKMKAGISVLAKGKALLKDEAVNMSCDESPIELTRVLVLCGVRPPSSSCSGWAV